MSGYGRFEPQWSTILKVARFYRSFQRRYAPKQDIFNYGALKKEWEVYYLRDRRYLETERWEIAHPRARGSEKLMTYYKLTQKALRLLYFHHKELDVPLDDKTVAEVAKYILKAD